MANSTDSSIYIKHNDCLEKIQYSSIYYLEASGSYCTIYTSDDKKITISQPLGEVANFLCPHTFIRIHRSFIINANYVDKYIGNFFIIRDMMLPIGRAYKKEALSHFNIVM